RHAPGSVKVHLRYSRLTLEDVQAAVETRCKDIMWSSWSSKQLQKAKNDIEAELKRRH
ncbi:unnamed protein product, partial [Effrenium voratum]